MREKILHELDLIPEDFIILVRVNADGFEEANMHFLKILIEDENLKGCYVTTNRTYEDLKGLLKSNAIDEKKLFFIDTVSKEIENPEKIENAVFLDAPNALTEVEEAVDEVMKKEEHGFILIDSISSMLTYNDQKIVLKFIHILAEKMRKFKVKGIFITLDEDTESELIDEIGQYCDRIIRL
jgi:KaiC/GvpD/RAD55 family RecA-like ATPase